MTKPMDTLGPAVVAAARAVRVKMPAPITTATPKIVRSHADSVRLSLWPGSSVSFIDCSTDLVRQAVAMAGPLPLVRRPGKGCPNSNRQTTKEFSTPARGE
jgi:hypothetical protein